MKLPNSKEKNVTNETMEFYMVFSQFLIFCILGFGFFIIGFAIMAKSEYLTWKWLFSFLFVGLGVMGIGKSFQYLK